MIRRLGILAGLALVLTAGPARAAAPNYIMVTGPGLSRPVLLADWNENLALLLAVDAAPKPTAALRRELRLRPRYRLSLFWAWSDQPRPTRPDQANGTGWFYPAHGSRRALVYLASDLSLRLATRDVLAVFAAHRVPLRR